MAGSLACICGVVTAEVIRMYRGTGLANAQNSLERCDLGVKTAALAALGEMAALRDDGVTDPLVLAWSGVKEGESTLNLFLAFSFWPDLRMS
jgi:hypothetical protein